MENVAKITTPAPAVAIPNNVIDARIAVVKAETGSYGAKREYAKSLNDAAMIAWFDKGTDKLPLIEAERQNLMGALKAVSHSNPHKVWADVRKYALEDAQSRGLFGYTMPVTSEGADSEAESTGNANINAPRPPRVRYLDELTALYSFGEREKAFLPDDLKEVHLLISKALGVMKVNLGMIKTGK
jgi:hypothetical protein